MCERQQHQSHEEYIYKNIQEGEQQQAPICCCFNFILINHLTSVMHKIQGMFSTKFSTSYHSCQQ